MATEAEIIRCDWAGSDPLYIRYHDEEWGRPCRDDARLFALLMLEGFQAGLSWITILRKREAFATAFAGWDAEAVAAFTEDDVTRLLGDPGIVRNRLKIHGAIRNANAYLQLKDDVGSFSTFVWSFVNDEPRVNRPRSIAEVPVTTPEAVALSKALKKRGFTFVGPTICYAFMQSAGLVDDHLATCICAQR